MTQTYRRVNAGQVYISTISILFKLLFQNVKGAFENVCQCTR